MRSTMIRPVAGALLALLATGPYLTTEAATPSNRLRVCAAENDLPYSDAGRQGFENRIAEVIAAQTKRELEFVWSQKDAIYLVRDYLDKGLCDLVMGVDTGDPRVLTTRPYYRSGYVFVYRQDRGILVQDWNSPDLQKLHRFAIVPGTPAETMLKRIGKFDENFNYMHSLVNFKSRRNQYIRFDPERLVREVAKGKADIAILWGPLVARFVKSFSVPLKVVLIPDTAEQPEGNDAKVISHYSQSLGVRKDDVELLAQLDRALAQAGPEIRRILEAEGVPLLPLDGMAANATNTASSSAEHATVN